MELSKIWNYLDVFNRYFSFKGIICLFFIQGYNLLYRLNKHCFPQLHKYNENLKYIENLKEIVLNDYIYT